VPQQHINPVVTLLSTQHSVVACDDVQPVVCFQVLHTVTSQLVSLLVFHLTALLAMRTIQQPAWYWCAVVSWWQLLLQL
jgi:glycerol uptake facilitator-like aquaporin